MQPPSSRGRQRFVVEHPPLSARAPRPASPSRPSRAPGRTAGRCGGRPFAPQANARRASAQTQVVRRQRRALADSDMALCPSACARPAGASVPGQRDGWLFAGSAGNSLQSPFLSLRAKSAAAQWWGRNCGPGPLRPARARRRRWPWAGRRASGDLAGYWPPSSASWSSSLRAASRWKARLRRSFSTTCAGARSANGLSSSACRRVTWARACDNSRSSR